MPLTRRMSGSLAPIQIGTPGPGAGISLDSPHLTGLSGVLASSGLTSPAVRTGSGLNPDAWKEQHAPAPISTTATRSSAAASGSSSGGGRSPAKRKSPSALPEPGAAFKLPDDDEDEEDADAPIKRPESPTKRRSSLSRQSSFQPIAEPEAPPMTVMDVYAPGMMRCPVFRIPSVLPLPGGVVLAFAEARGSWHDHGVIDLVCRRSEDDGYTWSNARVVVSGASIGQARMATVGNPCTVYDRDTGTVWMLFCSNFKEDQEWQIHAREGRDREGRRVWLTSSTDKGKTWATAKEMTGPLKRAGWTWYATGPGAGVQLQSGRLLFPCNHAEDVEELRHPYLVSWGRSRMVAHCVYSDDHGRSWHVGGVAADHTNEGTLAERADGSVILNLRDWSGRFTRQVQVSTDQGSSWSNPRYDAALIEPMPQGCHACILAVPPKRKGGREVLFFCNPASHERREMMTIRRSDDGGQTWPVSFVLEEGGAQYNSMGLLSSGALCVMYERADRISFATIPPSPSGPLGVF